MGQDLPPVRRDQPAAPDDQRLLSLRFGERRGHLPQVLLIPADHPPKKVGGGQPLLSSERNG